MTDSRPPDADADADADRGARKRREYPVLSNPNAPRFVVDSAIPVFLGVDFEVAFFTTSPDFSGKSIAVEPNDDGRTGRMRLPAPAAGLYLEVARARMNAQSAEQLAYALIMALIRSDYTSPEEFREIIDFGERNRPLSDAERPSAETADGG